MKPIVVFLFLIAALAAMPSAGYADEPVDQVVSADTIAIPAEVAPVPAVEVPVMEEGGVAVATPDVIVAGPIEPPVAVPAEAVEVAVPIEEKMQFEPFFDVSTPGNLVAVMGLSIPIIIEGVKLIPGVQAVWAGNLLRLIALMLGAFGGLAAYFGAFGGQPTYTLLVALICGMAGGGGFAFAKLASQTMRSTNQTAGGFATLKAMIVMGVSGVLLICMIGMVGCGTTFTAKAGEQTTTSIFRGPPGQMVAKVADKTACTVNSAPGDEMLITNPCKLGLVPWYNGVIVSCIDNPCLSGTLVHQPDGTVACK